MTLLLILGAVLLFTGTILYFTYRRKPGDTTPPPAARQPRTECCGQHAVCERDSLLAAAARNIEYYDDEELDALKGIPADAYDEQQADTFRDIFYTMRADDVPGWVRSLQLRGIELPDGIRDEVLLVVNEQRASHAANPQPEKKI